MPDQDDCQHCDPYFVGLGHVVPFSIAHGHHAIIDRDGYAHIHPNSIAESGTITITHHHHRDDRGRAAGDRAPDPAP